MLEFPLLQYQRKFCSFSAVSLTWVFFILFFLFLQKLRLKDILIVLWTCFKEISKTYIYIVFRFESVGLWFITLLCFVLDSSISITQYHYWQNLKKLEIYVQVYVKVWCRVRCYFAHAKIAYMNACTQSGHVIEVFMNAKTYTEHFRC